MRALKVNETFLSWINLYPDQPTDSVSTKIFRRIIYGILLFGAVYCLIIGSILYLFNSLDDMINATNALAVLLSGSTTFASFVNYTWKKRSIQRLRDEFQEIVDKNESNVTIYQHYVEAERKSRFYTKSITIFGAVYIGVSAYFLSLACAIFNIWRGNGASGEWFLPHRTKIIGAEVETVSGFFMTLLCQTYAGYTYFTIVPAVFLHFISCCFYIEACCRHFQSIFEEIDNAVVQKDAPKQMILIKNNIKNAILHHMKIMRLFEMLVDVISGSIFVQLLITIIFIGAALFQTELSMTEATSIIALPFNVLCIVFGQLWTFLLCYYATLTTENLARIANSVYNAHWRLYPPEVQNYLILVIARTQQTRYFTGFKLFYCNLETFAKLNNTAVSYFLMFHKLSQR